MRFYMTDKMTWEEIIKAYPSQWLGLTDVEWADDDHANIASARVSYTGLPKSTLLMMMHDSQQKIIARSTPQDAMWVGAIG